ncbi:uncharacterized protein E0L32_004501 [Thyridium curvatum]|uniref:Uncharacterized protein n=1 Tax=Thyridium curvatum TaxID=1093900 RepID=A0A507BEY8_9PEZI|nr:uncharacterized protein E0L32_004501 [Thyridium curvatum]TPX15521.1 hypothetical protein E0L32_004501 [Thyridium curvatum]
MGVNGLWTVLQPCARPTNLATLNRKRLAVDASIWIYQFLKAVRDKEGNALRNSHVVGFFRRICKLLWYGILPVFVFDGGAPSLKRATLQGRRRRREGRREDAVRTAGKLLAVQMKRIAEEDEDKRRRERARERAEAEAADGVAAGEALPSMDNIVYADEAHMSQQERQKSRRFHRQDAYHLPEMANGIEAMGRPDDPRIMSIDELEAYARQFHDGEDVNLYDFSKIDFDGEFFKSLPAADRYNILNAARIRSRLRMGLSKEQLEDMFPDRMAFSRFQIERVRERNHLTQRLMYEAGMTGTDLTIGVNARVAGEKDREYILVKNEGAEGGWALGVVSKEKDRGEIHKPIDVDALQFQYQTKEEDEDWEDEDDFEDVPIEGLNRLPKLHAKEVAYRQGDADAGANPDSMFVDQPAVDDLFEEPVENTLEADEDEGLERAIALSLQNQHGVGGAEDESAEEEFEDVPAPQWEQKAVAEARPITGTRGRTVANIVNSRANAAVPKRRESKSPGSDSDSDVDLGAALAAARKKKAAAPAAAKTVQPAPVRPNVKNPFDGPLPFEKLDWRTSIFERKPGGAKPSAQAGVAAGKDAAETGAGSEDGEDEELAGGFERAAGDQDAPRPLPPWMVDNTDIRESLKKQQEAHEEMDAEDRAEALEQQRLYRKYQQDRVVEIESSDDESDVEIVDPPTPKEGSAAAGVSEEVMEEQAPGEPVLVEEHNSPTVPAMEEGRATVESPRDFMEEAPGSLTASQREKANARSPSPEDVEFEDVDIAEQAGHEAPPSEAVEQVEPETTAEETAPVTLEDTVIPPPAQQDRVEGLAEPVDDADMALFADGDDDEFSDPEEEELLVQMAEEAEEHARFASTLNHKSTEENQEAYERELRALRTQQKKDRRDADEVTQIMVTECQTLLRLFGIPYITAPMEAEAQCAELVHLGLVDGIVTDDSDIFLFGGTRVYKNMFNDNKFVQLYLSSDLEKELSLSREQLIAIAQLLGSDYTEGLHGVGPVTAVEILSEFPGADGLAEFRDWWQEVQKQPLPKKGAPDAAATKQSSAFRRKFRKSQAAKLFLPPGFPNPAVAEAYLRPEVDKDPEPFQWGVPDLDALRTFLMATIGWSQERTDEVLVPVIKDMNRREAEGTQSNITRFYGGSAGTGAAKEVFAPRQRAGAGGGAGKGSKASSSSTSTRGGSRRMAEAVSKLRTAKSGAGAGDAAAAAAADGSGRKKTSSQQGRKRKARNAVVVTDEEEAGDDDDGGDHEAGVDDGAGAGRGRAKKAKASA